MPGVRGLSVRSRRGEASSGPVADPNDEVGRLVAQLTAGHTGEAAGGAPLDPTLRSKLAADLSRALAASAKTAGTAAVASGRWLGQVLIDIAPHLPLRDRATLEAHHGLSGEPLADALVRNAVRATTTVGAAGGSMAALHFLLPLSMALIPLELAAETLLVAAIEVKLVAELHEVYGVGVGGTHAQRGAAYTAAWSNRRGVDLARPASAVAILSSAGRRGVTSAMARRTRRSVWTVFPLFVGAVLAAGANRRETQRIADTIRIDLRRRRPLTGGITGRVVRGVLGPSSPPASLN